MKKKNKKPRLFNLFIWEFEFLKEIGEGNAADGIRFLINYYKERKWLSY